MKLSKLNIKKINLKDIDNNYSGQDILMKLGELYQFESGIYGYGNIWKKLEQNVERMIIEELDKAECIQVEFPILQPKKLWIDSNRWDTFTKENDTMFTLDTNLGEYGLAPTAEECVTVFGANRLKSYKSLPATYYQINEKFRKEKRSRGYLFRSRTFRMLDAYSFDKDEIGMKNSFNKMHDVFLNIFKKVGIEVISVVSDGGTMGGRISEEFQAITKLGEDTIIYDKERKIGINKEVLSFDDKNVFIEKFGTSDLDTLEEASSVELGNNFCLGTKYSESMQQYYIDENSNKKPYYMGCYGIGIGRILATIIENNVIIQDNELKGFAIPYDVAPYKLQIIYNENNQEKAFKLYNSLQENGINTIIDDRDDLTIGNKIQDVYVLGTPKFIILGKNFNGEEYEIEDTKTGEKEIIKINEIINYFK
ncbi:MAG: hypothetical protein IJR82_05750 [Bacilli bacterium]|nr:hypothetical protein [Bacilli bacterium]